jgi:hypothetical protein
MVDNIIVRRAVARWHREILETDNLSTQEWKLARNEWLRGQGIGGIIIGTKRNKSKTIPSFWGSGTQFWFADSEAEIVFILKWG